MSIEIEVGLENATKAPKITEELQLEAPAPTGFANPKVKRGLILGGIVGFKGWKRRNILRWLRCPTGN